MSGRTHSTERWYCCELDTIYNDWRLLLSDTVGISALCIGNQRDPAGRQIEAPKTGCRDAASIDSHYIKSYWISVLLPRRFCRSSSFFLFSPFIRLSVSLWGLMVKHSCILIRRTTISIVCVLVCLPALPVSSREQTTLSVTNVCQQRWAACCVWTNIDKI